MTAPAAPTAPVTSASVVPAARRRHRRGTVVFHAIMAPLTLVYIAPLVFVVLVAIRPFADITYRGLFALPHTISLDGFSTALQSGTLGALKNSVIVTICGVLISLVLSSMAAFALSRFEIPFRRVILLIMLAGNLLPPQILLIPVAKIAEALGIYDHLAALVVVQVGFGLGFYTFVLHGFMRSIPTEVFEAAVVDGAGTWQQYLRIVLPLCRPSLAALGALATTWIFNDLIWAMTVLRTQTKFPITAALLNLQGGFATEYNVVASGAIIAALPPAIVFFAFQRHFVSGLLIGANK